MYLDINEFEFPKADTVDDLIDIINDDSQFRIPNLRNCIYVTTPRTPQIMYVITFSK